MAEKYPNPFVDIAECIAHSTMPQDDCEYCEAEVTGKDAVVNDLFKANDRTLKSIAAMGAQVPNENFLHVRLELLIEVVFRDPRQRVHYEAEYHRRVAEALAELKQQVNRDKLAKNGLKVVRKSPLEGL